MTQIPKLAIFDIDGTIAQNGIISTKVLEGIRHLHELGCTTSVSTGRSYFRLREMQKEYFDVVISPDAPIIVDLGSKIVDREGNIIFGEFLSDDEIDHIIDFTRANIEIFKLVIFILFFNGL